MGSYMKNLSWIIKMQNKIKQLSILCLLPLALSAPQYTENQAELDAGSLDTIAEIFGTKGNQIDNGYSSPNQVSDLVDDVDVLVQVVKEANEYPNDYVPESAQQVVDKATVEVNTDFENCADYTESLGYECVPYYQCHNGTIITDGAGLIDIRNGFGSLAPEDSKCPGFLDVCCKDPDFVPPPPPKIKYSPKCGRRNQNGLGVRIQGFTESESQFGEWPHMCAILHEKPIEQEAGYGGVEPQTANLYQCGGSLIAPGTILTAAHCVEKFRQNPSQLKIRCGEWDTQNETEPYPHQDRYVEALNIHPEFDGRNLHNDFAVLFTSEDFVLASHIDTVCLPQADDIFEESTCFATGWGKDKFGSAGQYQVVLKEIDLPVVSNYECKDTSKGDGGSPLVCPSKYDPNTYVQAGMVAWGIGCGEDGTPGVYAEVSQATCWIDQAITCYYGSINNNYNSFLGYTSNVCQVWLQDKISALTTKREAAGKFGRIFQNMINGYSKCSVTWEQPTAPLVDISDFSRDSSSTYDVEKSEKQVENPAGSY